MVSRGFLISLNLLSHSTPYENILTALSALVNTPPTQTGGKKVLVLAKPLSFFGLESAESRLAECSLTHENVVKIVNSWPVIDDSYLISGFIPIGTA